MVIKESNWASSTALLAGVSALEEKDSGSASSAWAHHIHCLCGKGLNQDVDLVEVELCQYVFKCSKIYGARKKKTEASAKGISSTRRKWVLL